MQERLERLRSIGKRRQSPDQEDQARQETELRPSVAIQYAYYPQSPWQRIAAIPEVETAAEEFFSPEDGVTNILAIAAPPLPGLNIPHFYEEFGNVGGKYLEGYLQHTQTGFLKGKPFTKDELRQIREQIEERVKIDPFGMDDEERYQLHFIQSLLMFDRLATKRNFQLIIQPLTARDVISLFGKAKRLLKKLDLERDRRVDPMLGKNIQTDQDVDRLLEELRTLDREETKEELGLERAQQESLDRFIDSVVSKSLGKPGVTRIFIPREELDFHFDVQRFNQTPKNSKVAYLDPLFLGKSKIAEQIAASGKIEDPFAEVSQEESLYQYLFNILKTFLEPYALDSAVDNLAEEFRKNTKPEEVRRALIPVLQVDSEDYSDRVVSLLNFFGERTTGFNYGNIAKMMSSGGFAGLLRGKLDQAMSDIKIGAERDSQEERHEFTDEDIEEVLARDAVGTGQRDLEIIREEMKKMRDANRE